jgi:hypothetical protein
MKFKLDENFGSRTLPLFREAGHDADTVREEGLAGCSDHDLFQACRQHSRSLVTLDLDFADVVRFPPHLTAGIAVIRLPKNPSLPLLERFRVTKDGHARKLRRSLVDRRGRSH